MFERVYDPGVGEDGPWYLNDHCFVRGDDGTWHVFGITHAEPADPLNEVHLAHATSASLTGAPWRKQPHALTADFDRFGEVHLWAPHVVRRGDTWHMFYCAGAGRGDRTVLDPERYRIHLATSDDLWTWQRHPKNPLFTDGYQARDPMVLRHGEQWIMYYTANESPAGGRHVVCARTSGNLLNWSERQIVYRHERSGKVGGPCESPFVVRRGERFYLFIGPEPGSYDGTVVLASRDPLTFEDDVPVGRVKAHAAEVVRDDDGAWYVSHCGWEQGGLYLAPLTWRTEEAPAVAADVNPSARSVTA